MTKQTNIKFQIERNPGCTEVQIACALYGPNGYQQQVNSACRQLVKKGEIVRSGKGGRADPFTYHLAHNN